MTSSFDHQIAGHVKERLLKYGEACIIKPENKADLFGREALFYEKSREVYDVGHIPISRFIPAYNGVVHITNNDKKLKKPYLILADVTLPFSHPCIIDIKIGRQTYEPTACPEKVLQELAKYPHQHEIGFRITAMKIWRRNTQSYIYIKKEFGRSLTVDSIIDGLALFFFDGEICREDVILSTISELEEILVWARQKLPYKLYCSSILAVYEGEFSNMKYIPYSSIEHPLCSVKLIDFAHSVWNENSLLEFDDDYVYGLSNLIFYLKSILNSDYSIFNSKLEEVHNLLH